MYQCDTMMVCETVLKLYVSVILAFLQLSAHPVEALQQFFELFESTETVIAWYLTRNWNILSEFGQQSCYHLLQCVWLLYFEIQIRHSSPFALFFKNCVQVSDLLKHLVIINKDNGDHQITIKLSDSFPHCSFFRDYIYTQQKINCSRGPFSLLEVIIIPSSQYFRLEKTGSGSFCKPLTL